MKSNDQPCQDPHCLMLNRSNPAASQCHRHSTQACVDHTFCVSDRIPEFEMGAGTPIAVQTDFKKVVGQATFSDYGSMADRRR